MDFLTPQAALIAAALTVPSLLLLYFLKLRRRVAVVSSTVLWRRAVEDLQVNSPFQKLRRNLLLLIQLLILGAMLLAFARPSTPGVSSTGRRSILVIDQSASMNATDVKPTRLDEARRQALAMIDDLGAGSEMMVIGFSDHARVLQSFTSDRALLREAVRQIQATDRRTRLEPALQLIEHWATPASAAAAGATEPLTVHVLSDGRAGVTSSALGNAKLVFHQVGQANQTGVDNVAVVSLSARRSQDKPGQMQVFTRLASYRAEPVEALVTLRVGDEVRKTSAVKFPPAKLVAGDLVPSVVSIQFDLSLAEEAVMRVSHDVKDALAADDQAVIVLGVPQELRVLLVTQGNAFLQKAIEAVNRRKPALMSPAQFDATDPRRLRRSGPEAGGEGYDLIIYDGHSPKQLVDVDSLYLAATPPVEGLRRMQTRESDTQAQVVLDWQRDHPLLRWVVLDDLVLEQPGYLSLPDRAQVLAMGQSGPLMAILQQGGTRHVVASFDVLRSNWPMQVGFAVFMDNLFRWAGLGDQEGTGSFRPGDAVLIRTQSDAVTKVRYIGPETLEAAVADRRAVLRSFDRVGLYTTQDNVALPVRALAVNLLDDVESNLLPLAAIQTQGGVATGAAAQAGVKVEIWRQFIWAVLALLLLEWIVYTRRMSL